MCKKKIYFFLNSKVHSILLLCGSVWLGPATCLTHWSGWSTEDTFFGSAGLQRRSPARPSGSEGETARALPAPLVCSPTSSGPPTYNKASCSIWLESPRERGKNLQPSGRLSLLIDQRLVQQTGGLVDVNRAQSAITVLFLSVSPSWRGLGGGVEYLPPCRC